MSGLIAGCGGTGGGNETPTAEYLPLAVGNSWHYDVVDYSSSAQLAAQGRGFLAPRLGGRVGTAAARGEEVITITDTVLIGGSTWYEATLGYVGSADTTTRYLRHNSQGLMWKRSETDAGYYRLLAPLSVGMVWLDPLDAAHSFRVVSRTGEVATLAGTFTDCVVLEDRLLVDGQPDDIITTWFAPGVGMVSEEQHIGTSLIYQSELLSFDLMP